MSVAVVSLTVFVAIYWLRYEDIFVIVLVVKSGFFIANGRIPFKRASWEIQEVVLGQRERSCSLYEWALTSDHVLK